MHSMPTQHLQLVYDSLKMRCDTHTFEFNTFLFFSSPSSSPNRQSDTSNGSMWIPHSFNANGLLRCNFYDAFTLRKKHIFMRVPLAAGFKATISMLFLANGLSFGWNRMNCIWYKWKVNVVSFGWPNNFWACLTSAIYAYIQQCLDNEEKISWEKTHETQWI